MSGNFKCTRCGEFFASLSLVGHEWVCEGCKAPKAAVERGVQVPKGLSVGGSSASEASAPTGSTAAEETSEYCPAYLGPCMWVTQHDRKQCRRCLRVKPLYTTLSPAPASNPAPVVEAHGAVGGGEMSDEEIGKRYDHSREDLNSWKRLDSSTRRVLAAFVRSEVERARPEPLSDFDLRGIARSLVTATASDITGTLSRASVDVHLLNIGPAKPAWQWRRDLPRWALDVPNGYVRMGCVRVGERCFFVSVLAFVDAEGDWYPEGICEAMSDDEHEATGDIVAQWSEPQRAAVVDVFMKQRWEVVNDGR